MYQGQIVKMVLYVQQKKLLLARQPLPGVIDHRFVMKWFGGRQKKNQCQQNQ
jgi:hypothetical protein